MHSDTVVFQVGQMLSHGCDGNFGSWVFTESYDHGYGGNWACPSGSCTHCFAGHRPEVLDLGLGYSCGLNTIGSLGPCSCVVQCCGPSVGLGQHPYPLGSPLRCFDSFGKNCNTPASSSCGMDTQILTCQGPLCPDTCSEEYPAYLMPDVLAGA